MRTTLRGIDIIYKAKYTLVIRIIVLEGNFHIHAVFLAFEIQNTLIKRRLTLIQIFNKFLDTTLIIKLNDLLLAAIFEGYHMRLTDLSACFRLTFRNIFLNLKVFYII